MTKFRNQTKSEKFQNIALGLVCIGIFGYVLFLGIKSFVPEKEETIKFEVIGITNSTNATTLVQLHFECIKFCGYDLAYSSNNKVSECWKECSKLGGECLK